MNTPFWAPYISDAHHTGHLLDADPLALDRDDYRLLAGVIVSLTRNRRVTLPPFVC